VRWSACQVYLLPNGGHGGYFGALCLPIPLVDTIYNPNFSNCRALARTLLSRDVARRGGKRDTSVFEVMRMNFSITGNAEDSYSISIQYNT
jgi:hypothetical protein